MLCSVWVVLVCFEVFGLYYLRGLFLFYSLYLWGFFWEVEFIG